MYWIENMKDGRCIKGVKTYEQALIIQEEMIKKNIDTYIIKDENY